jgi:mRNA interferase MazF
MLNNKTTNEHPHCGEIWMCNLADKDGSIQSGYRPVFILSNDKNNTYSTTLNIIPITSKMNKRKLPVHVELWSYERYGLKTPSTMLIEQIMTISAEHLDRCIGRVNDDETLIDIRRAISVQFPILSLING